MGPSSAPPAEKACRPRSLDERRKRSVLTGRRGEADYIPCARASGAEPEKISEIRRPPHDRNRARPDATTSGGVAQRVYEAGFREPFFPEGATIAEAAGSTVWTRLVAGPREREVHAQGMAGADN